MSIFRHGNTMKDVSGYITLIIYAHIHFGMDSSLFPSRLLFIHFYSIKCFQHKLTNTIPFINRFHLWNSMYIMTHTKRPSRDWRRENGKCTSVWNTKCISVQASEKKKWLNENDDKCAGCWCIVYGRLWNFGVENDIQYSCDKSLLAEM